MLSAAEAERIIDQLAPLTIEEVGSQKWHTQHEWIERLNIQAHYNAQTHSDEFVVELLVSLDKIHVLVHDLLLIEAWKAHVYPLLAKHLAERVDSVTAYLLLYHEVTVANLLQVALYHSHAAESLSEDYALELADWCYRKLTQLNVEGAALAEHKERTAAELMALSRLDEQEEKRREVDFSVLMCSLAILRYLTDVLPRLPMGALSRMVSSNDTIMGLLPLLERPPWVRTRMPPPGSGGRPVLEKWQGNRWAAVAPADRFKITQTDGQVWLALTNLLVEPRCRAKYGMDEFRREKLLGLKRHLNELLFDQLPVLKDLQRVLDEMALGVTPDASAAKAGALILEAVPVVREAMLRGKSWPAVAQRAAKEHFGDAAARMARERIEAMVKHLDFLTKLEPEPPAGPGGSEEAAAADAPPPPVKVGTWRKVHDSGVYEPWYDFVMEVDDSRPPEHVEVAAANAGASSTSKAGPGSGPGGAAGSASVQAAAVVHGLRYRLKALDFESTRPLPANGKAVVRWGERVAEALIQLPELPLRDSAEGAPVLWVTVGLLAVDGVVLQVKLKKAPKPKERDRIAGVWYAYHPVAGALTVLREEEGKQQQRQQQGPRQGGKAAAPKQQQQQAGSKDGKGVVQEVVKQVGSKADKGAGGQQNGTEPAAASAGGAAATAAANCSGSSGASGSARGDAESGSLQREGASGSGIRAAAETERQTVAAETAASQPPAAAEAGVEAVAMLAHSGDCGTETAGSGRAVEAGTAAATAGGSQQSAAGKPGGAGHTTPTGAGAGVVLAGEEVVAKGQPAVVVVASAAAAVATVVDEYEGPGLEDPE